jgi:hypothetical protein
VRGGVAGAAVGDHLWVEEPEQLLQFREEQGGEEPNQGQVMRDLY